MTLGPEFYTERQGRPESKHSLDMEGRWPYIPPGLIRAHMIKDFTQLVTYLVSIEALTDDMVTMLLDDEYGLQARYELLDSWFTDLEDVIGIKATPAATGPVTEYDNLMAYIKQSVTLLLTLDTLTKASGDGDLAAMKTAIDALGGGGDATEANQNIIIGLIVAFS